MLLMFLEYNHLLRPLPMKTRVCKLMYFVLPLENNLPKSVVYLKALHHYKLKGLSVCLCFMLNTHKFQLANSILLRKLFIYTNNTLFVVRFIAFYVAYFKANNILRIYTKIA